MVPLSGESSPRLTAKGSSSIWSTIVIESIAAPAGPGLAPAPLRYRFAAMLYDALVMLAIWIVTIVALVTLIGDAVTGAWVQSLLFMELYGFFAFFWCRRGQTLGMLAWRLRLHSSGGFTPSQALRRFVAGLVSWATLGLGFFWMWFDKGRLTWPDRFSRSIVVRDPKRGQGSAG